MLLTRLKNAPMRVQKMMAGVLLILLFSIAGRFIWLIAGTVSANEEKLTELRERAGKLSQLVEMKNRLQPLDLDKVNEADRGLFLTAESLTIGRANLQSTVDAIAQSHNLVLASAGSVPDFDEQGIKLIGLRVDFAGTYEAIQKAIMDIETVRPPLFVRELTLQLISGDRQVELAAQIKIFGAFRLAGQSAPAAATTELIAP